MTWPAWLEAVRERYGSGQASVFVITGDLAGVWQHEGASYDVRALCVRMLEGTRDVIGTWSMENGLTFHTPHDGMRFRRHVEARRLQEMRVAALSERDPWDALALVWSCGTHPGMRQGYLLTDAHQLAPVGSKAGRWHTLPNKAPPLDGWPTAPALRDQDCLVLLFVNDKKCRPELLELPGAAVITVPAPPAPVAPPPPPVAPPAPAMAEVGTAEGPPAPPKSGVDPELSQEILAALTEACARLLPGPWPDLAPAVQALGAVLERRAPDQVPAGTGADVAARWLSEDVSARLSAETALDAAAAGQPMPEAAAAALARRYLRLYGGAPAAL